MIVVAIIGILAAIAIPAYQNYTAKATATSALADITAGKVNVEAKLAEGPLTFVVADSVQGIGLKDSTNNCTKIAAQVDSSTGATAMAREIKGVPKGNNQSITWLRSWDTASKTAVTGNNSPSAIAEATGSWY